jgi:DNA (cytosine-5)-methyltransferase 1
MNYLSVCSGIEAATVAWHHMGWKPVGFSEIEKFPSQVLAHHYPQVTNFGDMTKYKEWKIDSVGLLVGGTPCQSFSVAGLRKGLSDPRGNLALTYVGILDHFRPKWFIWENVPGVLSSNQGRDFAAFLTSLGIIGYGWSYRVLDAQYFGVAQRRRRVFVVGCLGDWRPAAEVLFESDCLRRDTKKGREKRKETTDSPLPSIVGTLDTECGGGRKAHQSVMSGHFIPTFWNGSQTAETITCTSNDQRMPDKNRFQAVIQAYEWHNQDSRIKPVDVAATLNCNAGGREGHLIQTVYENHPSDSRVKKMGDVCQTVTSSWGTGGGNIPFVQSFGWQNSPSQSMSVDSITPTLDKSKTPAIVKNMAVRRLTPIECERLQGFPDGYTDIKPNNKDTPDGHRYKALGNSMAVPVMRWIGERINSYEAMCSPTTVQVASRMGLAEV